MDQEIVIEGYKFWGYYTLGTNMKQVGGVYVIFDGQGYKFIDVGETRNLNERPKNHERKQCWLKNCPNGIYFAARVEEDEDKRLAIESEIRSNHPEMPCGEE